MAFTKTISKTSYKMSMLIIWYKRHLRWLITRMVYVSRPKLYWQNVTIFNNYRKRDKHLIIIINKNNNGFRIEESTTKTIPKGLLG